MSLCDLDGAGSLGIGSQERGRRSKIQFVAILRRKVPLNSAIALWYLRRDFEDVSYGKRELLRHDL